MTASSLDPVSPPGSVTLSGQPNSVRVGAVDLLRGLVMVLMALDHMRDFSHAAAFTSDPTDLATTTVPIFFTRWITHLCAPAFVFLAGTGAYLQLLRGKPRQTLSWFLVTRGAWLIVLEFTLVHLGISFRLDSVFVGMASVFWMIGVSMIVLAGLVWLPVAAVGALGVVMIVAHNAFDGIRAAPWGGPGSPVPSTGDWLWTLLHQPGMLPLAADGTPMFFVAYPLIPWIGVMAAGYAFGAVYRLPVQERITRIVWLGLTLLGTFVVLRFINGYGDPMPWEPQRSPVFTALSFLKLQKYPPSLLFLCATLGINLLLLAWFERRLANAGTTTASTRLERAFITFGRVPLFFFMLQWLVTHGTGLVAMAIAGQDYTRLLYHPIMAPPSPPGTGFSLPVVYAFWILGVAAMYLPCRWFANLKARRRDWWLSYF